MMMNDEDKYVVGIGEMLWDMLPQGKQLGGAPANFAYHVTQLGCHGIAVSALGNDALGADIEARLTEKEQPHLCQKNDYATGTVEVTLDEAGIPCYDIKENVAWDHIAFTPELQQLAQHSCAVCFGSLAQRAPTSRNTIRAFVEHMPKDEGHYKVFDINLRQHFYDKQLLQESMWLANVLKINDEELATVCQLFDYEEREAEAQCRRLMREYGLRMVILTCGTAGSSVYTEEVTSVLPTPQVAVADTVGAGDAFTAAFIAALLKGKTMKEAHQLAVAVSAYVCTQSGAMPEISEQFKV